MGKRWAELFRFVGVGWYVAACILLGTLGGRWLGHKLDIGSGEAIFTIIGLFLGLILAAFGVYRMLSPFIAEKEDNGREN